MLAADEGAPVKFGDRSPGNVPFFRGRERRIILNQLYQLLPFDEIRIGHRFPGCRIGNSSVRRHEFRGIHLPTRCRHLNQHIASAGSYLAQLRAHDWRSAAAEGPHIERSQSGVRHDKANGRNGCAKFLCDLLGEGSANILP